MNWLSKMYDCVRLPINRFVVNDLTNWIETFNVEFKFKWCSIWVDQKSVLNWIESFFLSLSISISDIDALWNIKYNSIQFEWLLNGSLSNKWCWLSIEYYTTRVQLCVHNNHQIFLQASLLFCDTFTIVHSINQSIIIEANIIAMFRMESFYTKKVSFNWRLLSLCSMLGCCTSQEYDYDHWIWLILIIVILYFFFLFCFSCPKNIDHWILMN